MPRDTIDSLRTERDNAIDRLDALREENAVLRANAERAALDAKELVIQRRVSQELSDKVADLEKKLKEKEASYGYTQSSLTRAEGELEQAHEVLDGVEGAPPREYEKEYGKGQRNVVTRLAGAFLAIAKRPL